MISDLDPDSIPCSLKGDVRLDHSDCQPIHCMAAVKQNRKDTYTAQSSFKGRECK